MEVETMKMRTVYRAVDLELLEPRRGERADGEETTEIPFKAVASSEEPAEQWFGTEILDHGRDSVDLSFFNSGRAPILVDHSRSVKDQAGVIDRATLDTSARVIRLEGRLIRTAGSASVLEMVERGALSNVSVGYRIRKMVREEAGEDGDVYRVVDWQPIEVSLVTVPADMSAAVGVGRAAGDEYDAEVVNQQQEDDPMDGQQQQQNGNRQEEPNGGSAPGLSENERRHLQSGAADKERNRIKDILALGTRHNIGRDEIDRAVEEGWNIERWRGYVLEQLDPETPLETPPAELDISPREIRKYSVVRALRALASGTKRAREEAAFEFEVSGTISQRLDREPNGIFLPWDLSMDRSLSQEMQDAQVARGMLRSVNRDFGQRDLNASDDSALVGTDHMGSAFIEVLRNAMTVRSLGATVLTGLVGSVAIPRRTAGSSAAWISTEDAQAAESEATFDQVTLALKDVACFTEITRRLLMQSDPSIEALTRVDIAIALALAIDAAAINGSGASGQPTGILQTTGIGDHSFGANGAAPDWSGVTQVWQDVSVNNALMGSLSWLTNAAVVGTLLRTEKASGTANFILNSIREGLLGYPLAMSNQVPSNLTDGTGTSLSALIFGNWRDLLIGEWGTIDLTVDPFTEARRGRLQLTAFQSVDLAVRHAESFSASQDVVTS